MGTCAGAGTVVLAKYSPVESRIFTVDICKETNWPLNEPQVHETLLRQSVGYLIDFYKQREKVVQIIGPSHCMLHMNLEADLYFIDGDHRFESVLVDSELALRTNPKIVVWHDYQLEGVKKYIDSLAKTHDLYLVDMPSIDNTQTVFYVKEPQDDPNIGT